VAIEQRPTVLSHAAHDFSSRSRAAAPTSLFRRMNPRGESVYKWELDKGDESLAIAVTGSLLLDDIDLVIQGALDGAGLAWVAEDRVAEPSPVEISCASSKTGVGRSLAFSYIIRVGSSSPRHLRLSSQPSGWKHRHRPHHS
jgi:hypothetical protein